MQRSEVCNMPGIICFIDVFHKVVVRIDSVSRSLVPSEATWQQKLLAFLADWSERRRRDGRYHRLLSTSSCTAVLQSTSASASTLPSATFRRRRIDNIFSMCAAHRWHCDAVCVSAGACLLHQLEGDSPVQMHDSIESSQTSRNQHEGKVADNKPSAVVDASD